MQTLESRLLKAIIDNKKCHMTQAEYDEFLNMGDVERSLWMAEFVPFRFFGRKIKLFVES